MSKPQVSIVMPLHRHKYLDKILKHMLSLSAMSSDVELVLCENPAKTDEAAKIIAEYPMLNIQHIESEPGANRARNKGIEHAKSDKIMLLDDDCVPEQEWLASGLAGFTLYPQIGVFGGPMKLHFTCRHPRWVYSYFMGLLGQLDYGSINRDLSGVSYELDAGLVSGNIGFFKSAWEFGGGFDEDIGQCRGQNPGGVSEIDEILFVNRLTDPRFKPAKMYFNGMMIWHQIDETRMNMDYFMKKAWSHGAGLATICLKSPRIKDFTVEDIVSDLLPPQWHALFEHHELSKARAEIAHEESFRIYLKNLMICRTKFFDGFFYVLLSSDRRSYESDPGQLFYIGQNFYDQFV